MLRQFELVERVKSYDPGADEDGLNRAYVYAMKMHGSQKRASGDPYFSHPIEVAGILTELKLDGESIITALLHDVVEDTDGTLEDIEKLFGAEIARLVDGVTKLGRLELQSERSKQAENFRKLVLAMSEDIRVLLVKLADRLHNMRTLHFVKSEDKRKRIARETMDIYAPLAARIGLERFKNELEDLAFSELNPDARSSIVARLDFLSNRGGDVTQKVIDELTRALAEEGVEGWVSGRIKSPYSIWRKMQHRNVGFEQLADIMAFRIVVRDVTNCYQALGVLHSRYPVVPGRFKDYVSTPKLNAYQSLHTGLIGPLKQRIEVQIRTQAMHEIAEFGVAAHWRYKQGPGDHEQPMEGRQFRWIRALLDILEHASNPDEFLEHTKLEMYQDQVFCFTPKGDLIALPRGATPIDFAYAVHSEVGNACVGCRVNGRMVPVRTMLQNGDQVEVVTSKAQRPSPDWENFVVTGKAKAAIRRFIRQEQREQFHDLGRQLVDRAFRQEGYDLTDKAVAGVLKKLKADSVADVYVGVGQGNVTAREVLVSVFPGVKDQDKANNKVVPIAKARRAKGGNHAVPIKGLIPGMAVHFAHCCHPLPGDRIVGIVTTGKGVTVHTIDCETLQSFQDTPERWVDLGWERSHSDEPFTGRLHLVVSNEPGSLGALSTVIGKNSGNITNLKITHRSLDFFEMLIDLEIADVRHLTNVMAALRAMPVISSVERARG
ncbi:RelA/SpoT family protein [Aquibaculum arenosum]|uniref:GTP pyrophosphokinase rsh n=1 Tax=Aquibaculum arenosum TaxID=3032591 RepID=A0ABT5YJM2_9PROT|nr:bifunctional (p)ppGpp synthetase/guanosine-3',5'-bis(diphosphate) 3'-pyrophosphohydrolase [Fodinicurvata sp. CAU 1616]MDF2094990.1 bifunctional (p)ppGpp synthetase/guanosine-3',5'-bis(diphosphate) 3'-pyrophosphohydrolase [Fodinicurvata sp. CAU 1616]